MGIKLYDNRMWLTRRYLVDKKKPEEIAKMCGVDKKTIYRKLRQFDLLKK